MPQMLPDGNEEDEMKCLSNDDFAVLKKLASNFGYELHGQCKEYDDGIVWERASVMPSDYDYYAVEIGVRYNKNDMIERFAVSFPGHGTLDEEYERIVMGNIDNAFMLVKALNARMEELRNA